MEIQLEVKIDSPEYEVDMKTGLDTLQGTSDTIRTIAETILKKRIVQKKFSDSSIRTKMKKTFEGSYGMFFSLYIGPDMEPQYKEVGRSALLELLSFFMHDALHLIPDFTLGNRAQNVLTKMGDDAEELTKQLRCQKNGLKTMHEICDKFGYPVTISYKKTNGDRLELIRIDRSTITNMVPKVGKEEKTIFAGITRFNIHTGNGRLLLKGDEETVSFGFGLKFKDMAHKIKKVFTENLNLNNGVSSESYINLKLVVNEVQRNDGAIIKYIVRAVYIDA